MGSRLLNGSLQLSMRVTLYPLILIVLSSTVTLGTTAGTSVKCTTTTGVTASPLLCIYLNTYVLLQHDRYQ